MLALFAQQRGPAAGAAGADDGLAIGMIIAIYGVIIAIAYTIRIFFLLTISRCLKEVSPRNRQMQPGTVWLGLIPLVDIVIFILIFIKVSDSVRDEYDDRGLRGDGDFGKTLGIVTLVVALLCGVLGVIPLIMYWSKIAGYTSYMRQRGGGYEDDDDEDDRPRKRRSRDDDDDDEEDDRPRKRRRSRDDDDDDE